jgi:hypothetical protein
MCKKLFLAVSFLLVFGLVVNASGQPTGQIMREVWWNIGGTLTTDLTNNAAYPDNPSFGELITSFEAPTDIADNYGQRIHGYLYPTTSGDYTFWIASDDASDLWLSTSDNPDDAVVICGVDGWTDSRQFDGGVGAPGSRQKSAPISLVGGQKYYISAIHKEGGGGDNLAVAWQGPDSPERSVIDGAFLSPAPWAPGLLKAQSPSPADGAVDAVVATLEWTSGALAVSHVVYLNGEKLAETDLNLVGVTLTPGTTYTWRVDEVEEDGTVIEGNEWTFTTLPREAHFPSPADGAENVKSPITLSWVPGKNTVINFVYFGSDKALVEARDPSTSKGSTAVQPSVSVGDLELFSTYYWAVDEFTPTGTVSGPVWSFSTEKYVSILSGSQTLTYDNSAEPYVSELALDTPADLTAGGIVSDLTLKFQGQADNLSVDEDTGTYQIAGSGADIWGNSDQFHYVYMTLNGDGEISARVVSNGTGSNTWAKGGVMIRQSTAPDSKQMLMGMTGGDGGGIAFQGRFADAGAASSSLHGDVIAAPPYWVKLTREGNMITAYASADGETWDLFTDTSPDNSGGTITNPIDVEMADPVLIGLFVTSHAAGEIRTYTFDNVSISGDVGELVSQDIDSISGNSAEPIYVKLEDSTGAVASVTQGYPAATQITSWRDWTIPLSKFEGVDPTAAAKLYVGVGNGEPGGVGVLNVADIRVIEPDRTAATASWQAAAAADSPVFIATNVADGTYDIGTYGGEQTYEFVVRSNPTETQPSMCLIGRRDFGDTKAGLKYEQWQNTGTYGATLFGVVDLDFGVANNPGADTDVVFVSSEASGTTALYVNGVYQASVDDAISLSGSVGIGYGIQDPNLHAGAASFDNFDGVIYGVAIYDAALSDEEIAAHSAAFSAPLIDVTEPGDLVLGIPRGLPCGGNSSANYNPCAELPPNVIDDNVNTKYLSFAGNFDPNEEPSGFEVTPYDGPSIVTGMTFTTANDAPERDPIAFELYGSNDGIDGPYTLIASGDIVDFAGDTAWPRYTKNVTPITFDNDVAYANYRVLFTAIRNQATANSMQIAEVEFLGVKLSDP